jgi:hypothetical protein
MEADDSHKVIDPVRIWDPPLSDMGTLPMSAVILSGEKSIGLT